MGAVMGSERLDARAGQVLALAQEEARLFRHNWIGTEHLLLGLARQRDGAMRPLLEELGVELEAMRDSVRAKVGEGAETPSDMTLRVPESSGSSASRKGSRSPSRKAP